MEQPYGWVISQALLLIQLGRVAFSPNLHPVLLCRFSQGEDENVILLSILTPSERCVISLVML